MVGLVRKKVEEMQVKPISGGKVEMLCKLMNKEEEDIISLELDNGHI